MLATIENTAFCFCGCASFIFILCAGFLLPKIPFPHCVHVVPLHIIDFCVRSFVPTALSQQQKLQGNLSGAQTQSRKRRPPLPRSGLGWQVSGSQQWSSSSGDPQLLQQCSSAGTEPSSSHHQQKRSHSAKTAGRTSEATTTTKTASTTRR